MIQAAVLDLDGTLIGPDEKLSEKVAFAVSQISQRIPVSIATGREAAHAIDYARQLGLSAPQISDGGATILDPSGGRHLWNAPLRPGLAWEIINALHATGTDFIATHPQGSGTVPSQLPEEGIIRVSALDMDEPGADVVAHRFQSIVDLSLVKVYLPYNDLWAVDFTASGVDKAAATLKLGQMIGVDAESMVAAGDSYNDLPLMRLCGLSIAMGGAPKELKEVADFVAPTVEEDGLAVAIEEFILPRM